MGARWENRAINYWPKAYDTGWFGVGGIAILIIFIWIVMRSTGAAHSGLPANTRHNADLFVVCVSRLGPSDKITGSGYASLEHGRVIYTTTTMTSDI